MSNLPVLPNPHKGVVLVVTVPSSVLYRDLSFRGNLAASFHKVYGINCEPTYIAYNAMQMWWDTSPDIEFVRQLSPNIDPIEVAQKSITVTDRNARQLLRVAQIVSSPTRWRSSHIRQDLLDDLNAYWDMYENHMTCLYTFWNVETLLTNKLIEELNKAGLQAEVNAGLPNFAVPPERNWFTFEQENLAILKSRFSNSMEDKTALEAASFHANTFGFISTLFNQGSVPTSEDILKKMTNVAAPNRGEIKIFDGLSEKVQCLGGLMRELAFWKHERQDAFALADQYVLPMYKAAADLIKMPLKLIYSMTRDEITAAVSGEYDLPIEIIEQRSTKYCRALINGSIDFYQPREMETAEEKEVEIAKNGDILRGMPTSPGVVRGKVRILKAGEEKPIVASDEIIVTGMTRPELGAALDVALAYATDEGGRLCHAAIVSREKKKPCVVGLGKATKVLRPGMIIEVDGTAGTVTVIETNHCAL